MYYPTTLHRVVLTISRGDTMKKHVRDILRNANDRAKPSGITVTLVNTTRHHKLIFTNGKTRRVIPFGRSPARIDDVINNTDSQVARVVQEMNNS